MLSPVFNVTGANSKRADLIVVLDWWDLKDTFYHVYYRPTACFMQQGYIVHLRIYNTYIKGHPDSGCVFSKGKAQNVYLSCITHHKTAQDKSEQIFLYIT